MQHFVFKRSTIYYFILGIASIMVSSAFIIANQIRADDSCYKITKVAGSDNVYLETKRFSGTIFSANTKFSDHDSDKRFTPTIPEIFKAEVLFKNCLTTGKKDDDGIFVDKKMIDKPSAYYRQYVGFLNKKGQKVIFFNCFKKKIQLHGFNWKKDELMVMDGGNAFFNVMINLTTQACSRFIVNGDA